MFNRPTVFKNSSYIWNPRPKWTWFSCCNLGYTWSHPTPTLPLEIFIIPPLLKFAPHPRHLEVPFDSQARFRKRRREWGWTGFGTHYVTEFKNLKHFRWSRFEVSFDFHLIIMILVWKSYFKFLLIWNQQRHSSKKLPVQSQQC